MERLKEIVKFLRDNGEKPVTDIADALHINPMELSGSLKAYAEIGLLSRNVIGRVHLYNVNEDFDHLDNDIQTTMEPTDAIKSEKT